jgi:hypothetical protein
MIVRWQTSGVYGHHQAKRLLLNFPRAVLHGPTLLGGIGIPSSSQKNTKDILNYFFYNKRRSTTFFSKIDMSIIYTQIEVGYSVNFSPTPLIHSATLHPHTFVFSYGAN